ncbi:PLP-dependent transferase [Piedraia hortae CBS 480.64]|uniref:PLP-dependent transferase n=1 Tax=Piedraia hortae CBS 480.64 TaxID=1314780 RepID=A0A6A7C126_9PEZI|nr:PLP-dependent transferase [Piedraia hortae CBS 480.64]
MAYPGSLERPNPTLLRSREYPQLTQCTYLDNAGTTIYARSLIEEFSADLVQNLYGNPHSACAPSMFCGQRVDAVRAKALAFFKADPEHFDLVFVANATAAIKLVAESLRGYATARGTQLWYGYHKDAHTSLVGIREVVDLSRCFSSDAEVEEWLNSRGPQRPLRLFAYPGQSNMTGRRLPRTWPARARAMRYPAYSLLDAAALASTAQIDLSDPHTAPDFTALSFYKIFGFPNLGALIVRKAATHALHHRRYFGGGTVDMVVAVDDTWHALKDTSTHDRLEDGTLPFHAIIALDHAINVHKRLYGPEPMKFVSEHTSDLARQTYEALAGLRHANGTPVCRIYTDASARYGDALTQGATIAFNIRRSDGSMIGYEEIERAANARSVYIRSGSLCNPGGVATYLGWTAPQMRSAYAAGHRCSKPRQIVAGKSTGVVRISFGAMNTIEDVQALLRFMNIYMSVLRVSHSPPNPARNTFSARRFGRSLADKFKPLRC